MPINKEILRLAIPNIISNISVPLLSTVDTALMGRLSELHLGAVGIGAMIFNFIYWNFGFLRMGTTGITAQAYGRKDSAEMMHTLSRASIVAFAILGWFFGMQNAIIPLVLTVLINGVNIICSFILVKQYNMGVAGVAWGTVIAQYVGCVAALVLFAVKYKYLLSWFSIKESLLWNRLTNYLKVNRDIFLRTICLTLVFAFFYSQSSKSGEIVLAINVVLLQFVNWMSYGIDGFAYASESLVGKYKGATEKEAIEKSTGKNTSKERGALLKVIKLSFLWGMSLSVLYALIYWFFGDLLLQIFTNQVEILETAKDYLLWMVLFPLVSSACYIWDGVFIGLTASKAMMQTMVVAVIIFFVSFYLLFPQFNNHGLWAAMIIFMLGRGLIQWAYYRKYLIKSL